MAWTAPMTATTSSNLTAAQWNTHVRDNLLETEAAKATALPSVITDPDSATEFSPGSFFVATAANAIAELKITEGNSSKFATEETTSTTYTDLDSYGPAITVITSTAAIVIMTAELGNSDSTTTSFADFAISGASTRAATDTTSLKATGYTAGDNMQRRAAYTRVTGLTAGSNTFTMKYRSGNSGDNAKFRKRQMVVWPI